MREQCSKSTADTEQNISNELVMNFDNDAAWSIQKMGNAVYYATVA